MEIFFNMIYFKHILKVGGTWDAMENDVMSAFQRLLDVRHRLVQLALSKPLRSRVHPHVLRLACRRMRWVMEFAPRVCALHNEPHHQRRTF